MSELYEALISRGDSPADAEALIKEMRKRVENGEDPEQVLYEEGLEPDYVFDILG
jgi:hypothetical protein